MIPVMRPSGDGVRPLGGPSGPSGGSSSHEVADLDQLKETLSISQSTLDVLQTGLLPAPTR